MHQYFFCTVLATLKISYCTNLTTNFQHHHEYQRRWRTTYSCKRGRTQLGLSGVLISLTLATEPIGGYWIDHWVCDTWPVRRQTYGYLPSCRASPPFGWYQIILLGDRGTWVWTTCPELLLGSGLTGSRTRDLSITSQRPNHRATRVSRGCWAHNLQGKRAV